MLACVAAANVCRAFHALCMVPYDLVKTLEAFTDYAGSFH